MKRTLVAAALLSVLAACGGGDDDVSGEDLADALDDMPKCSEVWVAGETLPEDYGGCDDGDTIVAAVSTECSDGTSLYGFDDRFYALGGEEIVEAAGGSTDTDPAYSKAYEDCVA